MMWVTISIGVGVPLVGLVFNTLITNKINDCKQETADLKKEVDALKDGITGKAREGFQTVFKRLDEVKEMAEKTFVRQDNYNISREYQEKATDEKFKSLLNVMNAQFENVEDKIDAIKALIVDKLMDKDRRGA